jgi:hypothetical protein
MVVKSKFLSVYQLEADGFENISEAVGTAY